MNKKRNKIKLYGSIFLLLALAACGAAYYCIFSSNTSQAIVYVPRNCPVEQLYDSLRSHACVHNMGTLRLVAKLKRYAGGTVRPGRYEVRKGMNNNQLINMFRGGLQQPISFTFNNVRSVEELAEKASSQFNFTKEEFMAAVNDSATQAELGFDAHSISALFLPNTYKMYWSTSPLNFLKRMKREYDRFWNGRRLEKAQKLGLSPVEVTTLASIVEEETAKAEEYPVIAGVYINRLKRGMKLDACPTIKYALGDFTITRVLDKHMDIDSPYNTYKHAGLPPGPIRIASIQVVDAVLNCQHHDYLYFCAKSDFSGYHNFSRTLRQHNAYAREYHRELNRRHIWK